MSIDTPVTLANQPVEAIAEGRTNIAEWAETALTILFATAAVLFVSFVAVVAGIV